MTRAVGIALALIGSIMLMGPAILVAWLFNTGGQHGFNLVFRMSDFVLAPAYLAVALACLVGGMLLTRRSRGEPWWRQMGAILAMVGLVLLIGPLGLLSWAHRMVTVGVNPGAPIFLIYGVIDIACIGVGLWLMLRRART